MNNQQRKYALERAQELTKSSLHNKQKQHFDNNKIAAVKLTKSQKRDLIRKGKVKIRSESFIASTYHNMDVDTIFDFSSHETPMSYKNEKQHEKAMSAISAAGQLAADTIMLGDSQTALDAIEKLSKTLANI